MTEIRCITTKQKKFLIKMCLALGIDVNELMEINNLTEAYAKIEELKKENKEIKDLLNMQTNFNEDLKSKLADLENLYTEVVIKLNQLAFDSVWEGVTNVQERKNA